MNEANYLEEMSSSSPEIPTCIAQIYFPEIAETHIEDKYINYQDF